MRRAVFPGSFDPITLGHVDIITRALPLFDEIIVAIGINADKKYMWTLDERKAFLQDTFKDFKKVRVGTYTGLTADYCKKEEAQFILRGLRNTTDFTYEQTIGQANEQNFGVDSIFLMGSPEMSYVSSTVVRDIARNGGDYSKLVPAAVK
jgi:pantetheine-phosphate adenylyltransferase